MLTLTFQVCVSHFFGQITQPKLTFLLILKIAICINAPFSEKLFPFHFRVNLKLNWEGGLVYDIKILFF